MSAPVRIRSAAEPEPKEPSALDWAICADVNHLKVPGLRGLAARAPYIHNCSATTLAQLVNFYNARFQMGLNPGQKTDLVNFLNAL